MKNNQISLANAVKKSHSIREVCRQLGYGESGGSQWWMSRKIKHLNLSTSHFVHQGRNTTKPKNRLQPSDIFKIQPAGSPRFKSYQLRRALILIGRKYECELCLTDQNWQGKLLVLHVDHVNGDSCDNLERNLRFLCPNCHSQTSTFGNQSEEQYSKKRLHLLLDKNFKCSKKPESKEKLISKEKRRILSLENDYLVLRELQNSSINFAKFGWVTKASKIIGISPQNVGRWVRRNAPEFYGEKCFKRKK